MTGNGLFQWGLAASRCPVSGDASVPTNWNIPPCSNVPFILDTLAFFRPRRARPDIVDRDRGLAGPTYITSTHVYIAPNITLPMLRDIYFKVHEKDYAKIKVAAKADDRTVHNWFRHLVTRQLEVSQC